MDKPATPQTITLGTKDLVERLETAKKELQRLRSPRVELDRDAILSLVTLCIQALKGH